MVRNTATNQLAKAKVRQSWSKYDLYNLSRVRPPSYRTKTFFQQKWEAKSVLRSYHSEQVREGQWTRMFARRTKTVLPMNPEYLAANDGSVESAGRGSGLKLRAEEGSTSKKIPYMQMSFAPLERRLDTAIFRSMFASSARQARQFVVHGAVKVNGKQMRYPGYLLNPGDMFQVDPERVMFATGAMKQSLIDVKEEDGEEKEVKEVDEEGETEAKAAPIENETEEIDIDRDPRVVLKELLSQAKTILASPREGLGAKRKQELRSFSQAVKKMLSRSKSSTILTDNLEAQFMEIQSQLKLQRDDKKSSLPSDQTKKPGEETMAAATAQAEDAAEAADADSDTNKISDSEYHDLQAALLEMQDNPVDDSKPYATPWTPKPYMSAFAFIPRYLEVNHNICAAVYLRHPVARPGLAEVPTPFSEDTSASAYAWYLRRR